MSFFELLRLKNYRNFNDFSIDLNKNCNILFGSNGSGKTNILESISLFEKGRGFRKDNLDNLVNFKSKNLFFNIYSIFNNNSDKINLSIVNEKKDLTSRKKIFINESDSKESVDNFESLFSIICFLPEMERLFISSPSNRRNFLDKLIYGVDRNYLLILNKYKKKLLERTQILQKNNYDLNWINQIENEIVFLAINIYKSRIEHIKNLNNILSDLDLIEKKHYHIELKIIDKLLEDTNFDLDDLKSTYLSKIKDNRSIDSIVGGCKFGPHKSDIFGNNLTNNIGLNQLSTGQQKTAVLLIIISQCKFLLEKINRKPVILFDEVCSHLDLKNRSLLLDLINNLKVQTIITGTEKSFFSFLSTKANYYNINEKK